MTQSLTKCECKRGTCSGPCNLDGGQECNLLRQLRVFRRNLMQDVASSLETFECALTGRATGERADHFHRESAFKLHPAGQFRCVIFKDNVEIAIVFGVSKTQCDEQAEKLVNLLNDSTFSGQAEQSKESAYIEFEHDLAEKFLGLLEEAGIETANWDGDGTPIEMIAFQIRTLLGDFNTRLAAAHDCTRSLMLKEAAMHELKTVVEELIAIIDGGYEDFDVFTLQPARAVLAKYFSPKNV